MYTGGFLITRENRKYSNQTPQQKWAGRTGWGGLARGRQTTRSQDTHHLSGVEVVLEEHGDAGGLDGDAAFLLILAGVREASLASVLGGDDARLGDQRIGQRGLAVVHVRDHGHVPDVVLLVHDLTELVRREVNLSSSAQTG